MGLEVKTLGDCEPVLEHMPRAAARGAEPGTLAAVPGRRPGRRRRHAAGPGDHLRPAVPERRARSPPGWQGFISDTILRELGIQLVDGRMPGFAAILGPAPDRRDRREDRARAAEAQHPDLPAGQPRRPDACATSSMRRRTCALGWDTVRRAGRAATRTRRHLRAELVDPQRADLRRPQAGRLAGTAWSTPASASTPSASPSAPIPDDWYAVGAGAILMGYPVISDYASTPEIRPTGVTTCEALVRETDYDAARADLHRGPRA